MRKNNKYTITINIKKAVKTGAIAAIGYIVGSVAEQVITQAISKNRKLKMYEEAHGVIGKEVAE